MPPVEEMAVRTFATDEILEIEAPEHPSRSTLCTRAPDPARSGGESLPDAPARFVQPRSTPRPPQSTETTIRSVHGSRAPARGAPVNAAVRGSPARHPLRAPRRRLNSVAPPYWTARRGGDARSARVHRRPPSPIQVDHVQRRGPPLPALPARAVLVVTVLESKSPFTRRTALRRVCRWPGRASPATGAAASTRCSRSWRAAAGLPRRILGMELHAVEAAFSTLWRTGPVLRIPSTFPACAGTGAKECTCRSAALTTARPAAARRDS